MLLAEWIVVGIPSCQLVDNGIDTEIFIRKIDQDVATTEVNLCMKAKNINQKSTPFVWWSASREKCPIWLRWQEDISNPFLHQYHLRNSLRWQNLSLPDVGVYSPRIFRNCYPLNIT